MCYQDSLGKASTKKQFSLRVSQYKILTVSESSTETNIRRTGSEVRLAAERWLAGEPTVAVGSWRPWSSSCWTSTYPAPSESGRGPRWRRRETYLQSSAVVDYWTEAAEVGGIEEQGSGRST